MNPVRLLAALGRLVLGGLAAVGRVAVYALSVISHLFRPPFYPREFGHALMQIGWFSLPVVGLTALFTGGALALQIYAGGSRFNAEAVVPSIVAIGMARELGPVLGGLMVAARVASSIAAEMAVLNLLSSISSAIFLIVQWVLRRMANIFGGRFFISSPALDSSPARSCAITSLNW